MSQDIAGLEAESQAFIAKLLMTYKHNLVTVDFEKNKLIVLCINLIGVYKSVLVPSIAGFISIHFALHPVYIVLLRSGLSMTTLMSGINNLGNKMLAGGSKDCCLLLIDV